MLQLRYIKTHIYTILPLIQRLLTNKVYLSKMHEKSRNKKNNVLKSSPDSQAK